MQYAIANESVMQTIVKDVALKPIHLATKVLPWVVVGVGALLLMIGVAFAIVLVVFARKSGDNSAIRQSDTHGNENASYEKAEKIELQQMPRSELK